MQERVLVYFRGAVTLSERVIRVAFAGPMCEAWF